MTAVPEFALQLGFVNEPIGSHTSRTMMFTELRSLFAATSTSATTDEYRSAVVDENVLARSTVDTRRRSFRQLRELYGMDSNILIFRVLTDLWNADDAAQPLLALLCAAARDPLLRATAGYITQTPTGSELNTGEFADILERVFPGRYKESVRKVTARNLGGTWRQSGHLAPAPSNVRTRAVCRPTATTFALLLGYLCGARGELLFQSLWVQLLDQSIPQLHEQAAVASRQGWLEYRHAGGVTEITFGRLLGAEGMTQ